MNAGRVSVGHPVDVGSGAVFTLSTDFHVPGSLPVRWRRHYSTVATSVTWLGPKWTVPYFMRLQRGPDRYILSGAHGEEMYFPSPEGALRIGEKLTNLTANMELQREFDQYRIMHWHTDGPVNWFSFKAGRDQSMALSAIENACGHRVRLEYDATGRPVRLVQELEQRAFEIAYDRRNLIRTVHFLGSAGPRLLVGYEYDARGRLTAALDALGYRKGYEYDHENRMTAESNPLGSRFVFQYDRQGRCIRTAGSDGFLERNLQYSTAPSMTRVTNSRGGVTEYYLNASGQVIQMVNPVGGVTTNTFDEHGRLVGVIRPDGAKESFAYDAAGNLASNVDPSGAGTTTEHDENHTPTRMVDPNGNPWDLANRNAGSLLGVESLPPVVWKYARDSRGLVTVAESWGGRRIQVRRGPRFRSLEHSDQISLLARTEFDEMGFPTEEHDAGGGVSRTRYDELHRPVEVSHVTSGVVRYRWNAGDRVAERTGPGDQRIWLYDHNGYLATLIDTTGDAVSFEYDKEGKLAGITNRVRDRTEYRRDADDRIVEERLFDGRVMRYEYDLAGRRVRIHLADGRTVQQKFDHAGRLLSRETSDGLLEEFEYDKIGRAVKASNGHAVVELVRDRFGRIRAEIQNGRSVAYRYDSDGKRNMRFLPLKGAGCTLRRTFDMRGRLNSIGGDHGPRQHLRWDTLDRLVERRSPGGVVEVFTYDDHRRLHEHRVESAAGRFVRTHTYDLAGNLTRLVDEGGATTQYAYDQTNRLIEVRRNGVRVEAYEYDANDSIRATHRGARQLGPGGRVVQDGSRELSYAADGSVAETRSDGLTRRMKHDVNGRLVEIIEPGDKITRYEYDPFGRRTAKVVAGARTEFLWEGWSLAAEVRGEDVLRVHASLDIRPLVHWQGGRLFTPILDHRGSVRAVFDETGRQVWNCILDAYGKLVSETGNVSSPFRLRGQYHDAESGLYYNFNRHYDPQLGDYTAPDPIGIAGGHHFYAYPRNPLRWDDPFGLECVKDKDGNPIPADDERHPRKKDENANGDPSQGQHGPGEVGEATQPHLPLSPEENQARQDNAKKAMDVVGIPEEQQGLKPGQPYDHDIHDTDGHPAAGQNAAGIVNHPEYDPNYPCPGDAGGIAVGPAVHDDNPPALAGQNIDEPWQNATPQDRAQAVAQHEQTEKGLREQGMGANDAHNEALNQAADQGRGTVSPGAQAILDAQEKRSPRAVPDTPANSSPPTGD